MWTRRDSVGLMTAAAAAFGLTLAAFWSTPIHAVDATPAEKAIAMPIFHDGTCEVSATVAAADSVLGSKSGNTYVKPGEAPPMQVAVHNTGTANATAHFTLALDHMSMRDMESRVIRVRPAAWSQDYEISLAPGETKSIDVSSEIKLEQLESLSLFVRPPVAAADAAPTTNDSKPALSPALREMTTRIYLVSMSARPMPEEAKPAVQSASATPTR